MWSYFFIIIWNLPYISLEYGSAPLDTSRRWSGMWVFASNINRLSSNLSKASEITKKIEENSIYNFGKIFGIILLIKHLNT